MEKSSLNPIQLEILKALEEMSEKSTFTEYVLAKKIRENAKIDGKNKAGIGLADLEKVLSYLDELEEGTLHYSLIVNSANALLLEKTDAPKPINPDSKKRRQTSEKYMSILTSGDLKEKAGKKSKNGKDHKQNRSQRQKIDIYSNYEDLD